MQKQYPRGFSIKKSVLKNFTIFTGKHRYQSLSFDKFTCLNLQFMKKETSAQVFSYEFCGVFWNTNVAEHM